MTNQRCFSLFAEKTGFSQPLKADLSTLTALHRAWISRIPFENIEVFLGRPVSIRPAEIADKLLKNGRGGYCFEHNLLFRHILEEAGFQVTPHLARVVWGLDRVIARPQTHMMLLVSIGKYKYLADVGFGGISLTAPLRLEEGDRQDFMLQPDGSGRWLLSVMISGRQRIMYLFDERPCEEVDILVASHFVATHPDSHFRHNLILAKNIDGVQVNMLNRRLVIHDSEKQELYARNGEQFREYVLRFFSAQNALSENDIQRMFAKTG